jgi:hypothetical protein
MGRVARAGELLVPHDDGKGYLRFTAYPQRKHVRIHRAVFETFIRLLKPMDHIDHINGNRSDNRLENLRVCNNAVNQRNRRAVKGSKSKYKGVTWSKCKAQWRARISCNGETHFLGYYDTEIEAARAYNIGAKAIHGKFARINDI